MRRFGRRVTKSFVLAVSLVIMLVAPVLAALFSADILVQETAGTTYGMLGIRVPTNVSWWAANGYIDADGRDTRVKLGSTDQPHMLQSNNIFFATAISGNSSNTYQLTTNETAQDMHIVLGYSGNITTADNTTLELGDNFTIEQSGWWDTSYAANKNAVYKQDAFRTYVSATGNITSAIAVLGGNIYYYPSADGNYTQWTANVGTRWDAINDVWNAADDNITYVSTTNDGDRYSASFTDLPATAYSVTSVTIYARCYDVDGVGTVNIFYRQDGSDYDNAGWDVPLATWTNNSWVYNTNPATIAPWTAAEVNGMEWGIRNNVAGFREHQLTQMYAVVVYDAQLSVTVPCSSAVHIITTSSNTTHLRLSVDNDTSWDGVHSASVASGGLASANNTSNWIWMQNNVMSYADNITLSVNGTRQLYYQPNAIISGTTLPDLETATNNDGTISFGTNPTGISVSLGSFDVVAQPTARGLVITTPDTSDIVTAPGTMILEDFEMTMSGNEFYPFVLWLSGITSIDVPMLWWYLTALLSIVGMAVFQKYLRNVWITGFTAAGIGWFMVSMSGLEWWVPVPLVLATLFIGLWKRSAEV